MANYFCTDSVEEQVDYLTDKVKDLKTNKSNATNLENGSADVLIQTTDTNHSFKVMADGRAKVQTAPTENDDVVRKLELDGKLTKPTNPSAESAVTMAADGTVGTKLLSEIGGGGVGGGKLYRHDIELVNNTVMAGSPPPANTAYQMNITLLDRNIDEINTVDKFIARFDNYIYRSVVFFGRYSTNVFYGESYNTLVRDYQGGLNTVELSGSAVVNGMADLDPLGVKVQWIIKTYSGSTATAADMSCSDKVTEV